MTASVPRVLRAAELGQVLGAVVLVGPADGAVGVGTENLPQSRNGEGAGVFSTGGRGWVSRGTAMIQLGQGEVESLSWTAEEPAGHRR